MVQFKFFFYGKRVDFVQFPDCRIHDAVLEARTGFVANKPLVLRKWQPGMQMLNLSLSKVPLWMKIWNLLFEFGTQFAWDI